MIKLKDLIYEGDVSYRGLHTAPDSSNGSPLYDVSGVYPLDIYSLDLSTAARYYGDGDDKDINSLSIIRSAYKKPNIKIKIYRAVPNISKELDKKLKYYSNLYYYVDKFGFPPIKDRDARADYSNVGYKKEKYLDRLRDIIEKLNIDKKKTKLTINSGDWVTINRSYAVEHGESNLQGNYKILTITTNAKNLYTTGDSLHEWGYNI